MNQLPYTWCIGLPVFEEEEAIVTRTVERGYNSIREMASLGIFDWNMG